MTGPTQVAAVTGVVGVQGLPDGSVLVRVGGDNGPYAAVVDPSAGAGVTAERLEGVLQSEPVGVLRTDLGRRVLRPSATADRLDLTPSGPALTVPGAVNAVDVVPSGDRETVVLLRTSDRFTLAVSRGTLDLTARDAGSGPRPPGVETLSFVHLGRGLDAESMAANLHLAAGAVAVAAPADGPGGPWWEPLAAPEQGRSAAQLVLLVAGLALFWLVLRRLALRRRVTA